MPPRVAGLHLVGFSGDEYARAIRVFGRPSVIHMSWDQRARREIADSDVVVFARCKHDQPAADRNFSDTTEKLPSGASPSLALRPNHCQRLKLLNYRLADERGQQLLSAGPIDPRPESGRTATAPRHVNYRSERDRRSAGRGRNQTTDRLSALSPAWR